MCLIGLFIQLHCLSFVTSFTSTLLCVSLWLTDIFNDGVSAIRLSRSMQFKPDRSSVGSVIELNASSYLCYHLKHIASHEAQRYDEVIKVLQFDLAKLHDAHHDEPEMQVSPKSHACHYARLYRTQPRRMDVMCSMLRMAMLPSIQVHISNYTPS